MEASPRPVASPIAVLREEFDDWGVLFNPDTAEAYGINPVAVAAWKMMDGAHSIQEICTAIGEGFANVPENVGEEIKALVDDLETRGFVGYEKDIET